MRLRSLPFLAAALFASAMAPMVDASDTATAQIVVTAHFNTRTSLKVSTERLLFDVPAPGEPATIAVDFSAGARTASGGEVVLSIEPLRVIDGPGGAADVDAALSFAGVGEGTTSGLLSPSQPSIAGRWSGSGLRNGRVTFTLRARAPGTYVLPVRFVLTAP